MTDNELIDWISAQAGGRRYLTMTDEILNRLEDGQAEILARHFGHTTLIVLPKAEVKFYEWLREKDPAVWHDLWDSEEEEPYVVGISFLPLLLDKTRGFPICDLLTTDNYYFAEAHFAGEESSIFVESVRELFLAKKPMTVAQTLVLEISIAPVDIWHFAYKYNLSIESAKQAVHELVNDKILIHLTNADHLAGFIEF